LNTLLTLELGVTLGANNKRESAAFRNGHCQMEGVQRHHAEGLNMSKIRSTKTTEIHAWWKAKEYPRDPTEGAVKVRREAVPATIVAQAERERPKAKDPITPAGQIWHCARKGAEEHEEALKVVGAAMDHESHSDSDEDINTAQSTDPFVTIVSCMSEPSKIEVRRAAFNARLT
jgi:hypothetical protein